VRRSLAFAFALAFALSLATAGCSSPAAPPPSITSKELVIDEGNDPKFEQGAGGFLIVWNFSLVWEPVHASGTINLTLDVKLYGRQPAGTGAQNESFAAGEKKFVKFRTQFLGIGDYRYTMQARDTNGTLVGEKTGLFETCLC
jgi:hypothetical protein